jgi:hypothetical protein
MSLVLAGIALTFTLKSHSKTATSAGRVSIPNAIGVSQCRDVNHPKAPQQLSLHVLHQVLLFVSYGGETEAS